MIILGAGLAGLSAAYFSHGVLYEMDSEIGGQSRSKNVDGFVFDRGIHVLQTQNDLVLNLFRELGVRFRNVNRSAWIYTHGTYRPYPLQMNTAGLPLWLRANCILGFMASSRSERAGRPEPRHYQDWLESTLGKGFARHFVTPYSEKFWTVHPNKMTYEWAGIRVPRPPLRDVLKGAFRPRASNLGTNAEFRYPEADGFGGIVKSFPPHLNTIRLNKTVTRIDGPSRRVQFNGNDEVGYSKLISTLPLPEIIRVMTAVPAEVREAAERLAYNSILVVNLAIERPQISDKHWIHYPEEQISFFRISFPTNFAPGMAPKGLSSVSAEISYSRFRPLPNENIVERTVEDLLKVGILRPKDRVLFTDTMDLRYGYVIYDEHRSESVKKIHRFLEDYDIIPCGRYGSWAYYWSHEAVLSGREAALTAQGLTTSSDVEATG